MRLNRHPREREREIEIYFVIYSLLVNENKKRTLRVYTV